MGTEDQDRRAALADTIEKKLAAASTNDQINHDAVRANDPGLAEILDEFLLSKSYRTDPKTTAKQVAEVLLARDPDTKLGRLIGTLSEELKRKGQL